MNPNGIEDERFFEILEAMRRPPEPPADPTGPHGQLDGRAALRAALVRETDGSYRNVLGYDGPSFDEVLALARATLPETKSPDFGSGD